MKSVKLITATLGLLIGSVGASQAQLTLGYVSTPGTDTPPTTGSQIVFAGNGTAAGGGTFTFAPGTVGPGDFIISSTTDGSGLGDVGVINGSYKIGAITTVIPGVYYTAPVTDITPLTDTISISDGLGVLPSDYLTAKINWMSIDTVQTSDGLNAAGSINLTVISYSGTQLALQQLAAAGSAGDTLSFNFNPARTLPSLSDAAGTSSFNGNITVVPEPSSIMAGAMLLLPFGASTLRFVRKNRAA